MLSKFLILQGEAKSYCFIVSCVPESISLYLKGALSRVFCCFVSIPFKNHYFKALIVNKKSFCRATTKISNEFYQRGLTIINFLSIFGTRGIRSWKNWPIFSNFNPFPSMQSLATGDKKQFEYLQIVFYNKTRSLVLEFSWCKDI